MGNKTRIIMVSLGMSFCYQYLILKLSIIWLKKKTWKIISTVFKGILLNNRFTSGSKVLYILNLKRNYMRHQPFNHIP